MKGTLSLYENISGITEFEFVPFSWMSRIIHEV